MDKLEKLHPWPIFFENNKNNIHQKTGGITDAAKN